MARAQQTISAKSKTDVANAAPPVPGGRRVERAEIAARAYELWVQSGKTHGRDQEHWFRAEQELRARPAAR